MKNNFRKGLSNISRFAILMGCAFTYVSCGLPSEEKTTSSDEKVLDQPAEWVEYVAKGDNRKNKRIVLVSGDEEYRSEEALPQLGKILTTHHGYDCTVLFAQDPAKPGMVDPNYLNNIPGLEALEDADLMILFTRFRELPDDQMQQIDHYLMHGKPVLALRTATHAFSFEDSTHTWRHYGNFYDGEKEGWKEGFGRLVLGERWYSHHGHHKHQSTKGLIAAGAKDHPIAKGIKDGDIWGSTDVYGVRLPLPGDSQAIIMGQVIEGAAGFDEKDLHFGMRPTDSKVASKSGGEKEYNPNDPMMPIAWTKSYQLPGGLAGQAFTSTIGASADLMNEGVRRLLVNATYWLTGAEVPGEANVDLVGSYQPSQYSFHKEEGYWASKGVKVSDAIMK